MRVFILTAALRRHLQTASLLKDRGTAVQQITVLRLYSDPKRQEPLFIIS